MGFCLYIVFVTLSSFPNKSKIYLFSFLGKSAMVFNTVSKINGNIFSIYQSWITPKSFAIFISGSSSAVWVCTFYAVQTMWHWRQDQNRTQRKVCCVYSSHYFSWISTKGTKSEKYDLHRNINLFPRKELRREDVSILSNQLRCQIVLKLLYKLLVPSIRCISWNRQDTLVLQNPKFLVIKSGRTKIVLSTIQGWVTLKGRRDYRIAPKLPF